MRKYVLISIGGFVGAIFRYLFTESSFLSMNFPVKVFIINILGSLLLAFFLTLTFAHWSINPNLRIGIATGFFGAFTTFSTFCKDTIILIIQNDYITAFLNILLSIVVGLISAYIGIIIGREIIKKKEKHYD